MLVFRVGVNHSGRTNFHHAELGTRIINIAILAAVENKQVGDQAVSSIYMNVKMWLQNRRFALKLGPSRSVSVQITPK